jgi:hypothetical protein
MRIAFNNLAVAQHQNMLRYTKMWSGTFEPKLQQFVAGDFVYTEEAEDRLSRPEGWTVSPKSQVCRQWGSLGPRGTGQEADQGSCGELCSLLPLQS